MSDITHAGLLNAHAGENFCILLDLFTDVGDYFLSVVQCHPCNDFLGFLRCFNRFVHISEHASVTGNVRSNLHLCQNFLHDILNHLLIYRHSNTSLKTSFP